MEKTSKIETIIAMYIVAMGEWNGVQWELFPNLPNCFANHINFNGTHGCYADFLRLTVNDLLGVEVWFADEHDEAFWCGLEEIKHTHPLLFTSIVTHVYDMVLNIEKLIN